MSAPALALPRPAPIASPLRYAVVGVLFALLFHLVNFAITIFSPTVQVLRLHYVEFFGTFFSPGGSQYRPFTRWAAQEAP